MITADYQTLQTYPFTVSVTYIINYASKVGRIAKKFADAKFCYNGGFCSRYHATYAFKSAEVAALCKTALEAAFAGIKDVTVGEVTDTYMKKVEAEIYRIEHEKI